jgi:hypothetical protein
MSGKKIEEELELFLLNEFKDKIDERVSDLEKSGVSCLKVGERKKRSLLSVINLSFLDYALDDLILVKDSLLNIGDVVILKERVCRVIEQTVGGDDILFNLSYENFGDFEEDDFMEDDSVDEYVNDDDEVDGALVWGDNVENLITFGEDKCIIWHKRKVEDG